MVAAFIVRFQSGWQCCRCRELLFAVLSGLLECHWQQAFSQKSLWGRTSVVRCLRLALKPHKAPAQPYHLSYAAPLAPVLPQPPACMTLSDTSISPGLLCSSVS